MAIDLRGGGAKEELADAQEQSSIHRRGDSLIRPLARISSIDTIYSLTNTPQFVVFEAGAAAAAGILLLYFQSQRYRFAFSVCASFPSN